MRISFGVRKLACAFAVHAFPISGFPLRIAESLTGNPEPRKVAASCRTSRLDLLAGNHFVYVLKSLPASLGKIGSLCAAVFGERCVPQTGDIGKNVVLGAL